MKSILRCFAEFAWPMVAVCATALLAATASAIDSTEWPPQTTVSGTVPAAGDQLVLEAISQLERRDSVAARLRHQISLGVRQLSGTGNYWQQGSGESLRVRLELRMQAGTSDASLLQVSNGRFLWVDSRLPNGRFVSRLDLRQLRNTAASDEPDADGIQPGQASWLPLQPELESQYGGLPKLLSALADSFTFSPPQAMQLKIDPPLVAETTSLPVYATVGHWKPERLATIAPQAIAAATKSETGNQLSLPSRIPPEVLLLVGQSDLFPYRIEYRALLNPPSNTMSDAPDPYMLSAEPLALLELSDVTFNVAIPASQFDYSPGEVDWDDLTAEQVQKLRKTRGERVASKPGH